MKGNPQLENGHTRIANELLEALTGYPFGGGELKVVLAIVRLTYGWNRKRCVLRQTTLAHLTRLDRRQIQRVLTALRQQGVLFRDRTTRPFTYQLNKSYQGWRDWPACELSSQPDTIAAAAPDTCVRPCKEIKKEYKDRTSEPAVDNSPAVDNLRSFFSRFLNRPLTDEERWLIAHLYELSPQQAQQLLEQVSSAVHSSPTPTEGASHVEGTSHSTR